MNKIPALKLPLVNLEGTVWLTGETNKPKQSAHWLMYDDITVNQHFF